MKRGLLLTLAIVMILVANGRAEEILLKQSFFSGWKYSTNGVDYEKVGMSASGLRMVMGDNEEAQQHLSSYKSSKTTAMILGILGAGTASVAGYLAGSQEDDEDKDNTTPLVLLIASVPLLMGAGAAEVSATNHLLEAVRLHNNESRGAPSSLLPDSHDKSGSNCYGLVFSYRF